MNQIDWDKIYKSRGMYSGNGSRGRAADLKKKTIEALIRKYRPKSILDVGFGDLHIIQQIDLSGIEYTGLDSSEVAIEAAQNSTLSDATFLCDDFLVHAFETEFDLVICLDVLIHIDVRSTYLATIEKLKKLSRKSLLVSGYKADLPVIERSGVVFFHDSIKSSFPQERQFDYGEYNNTTLLGIKRQTQQSVEKTIWTYWETAPGSYRPEYLNLCEETWRARCDSFEIIRVTPENVSDYAPNLREEWNNIPCLAHKADYLRAVLVYNHGGIWLDADMIALNDLSEVIERLNQSGDDFIGCGRPGNRPSNGFFGGAKNSNLLGAYIEKMDEFITSREGDLNFKWTAIGYDLLWPLTRDYQFFQYEFRRFIPVHPSHYETFFETTALGELEVESCDLRDDTMVVYLYNAMFPKWFKTMSRNEVLSSDFVVGQLFRLALS